MQFLPLEFKQIKFDYDVDVLMPLIKASINTKIDVQAEPSIGTAIDNPPLLRITWFHQTKYQSKRIINYESEDNYVCLNIIGYQSAITEFDTLIANSYNKVKALYAQKAGALGLGTESPDFSTGNVKIIRDKIIEVMKRKGL